MVLGHEFSAVVAGGGRTGHARSTGRRDSGGAPSTLPRTLHQRHAYDYPKGSRRGCFETPWGIATYGGMTRFGVYDEELGNTAPTRGRPAIRRHDRARYPCAREASFRTARSTVRIWWSFPVPDPSACWPHRSPKRKAVTSSCAGIDGDRKKLEVARELGADEVYNVDREDLPPAHSCNDPGAEARTC